jgi:aspartyl protease family protein
MRTHSLLAALLAAAAHTVSAQSVALSGVAGNKALVTIDGSAPRFLSPGQSHQGVTLLSTQGDSATVSVNGQRQTLRVGDAPVSVRRGAAPTSAGPTRIVLTADGQGHFMPTGQINGRAVQFMVDTGASQVVMSESDARRINLKFEQGQPVRVSTANGMATGYRVVLSSVRVGEVQVYEVAAIVLPQAMPYILLGNSFLTRFQMQRNNDQMTLERRF